MTRGVRVTVAVVVAALLVLIIGVPLSLYEQNQSAIRRNSDTIVRLTRDEADTKKVIARLATDEAETQRIARAQRQSTCLNGNDYRAQDSELWHFIFNAFPNPHPTPEEKRRTAQFLMFLAEHDKQRDCSTF